MELWQHKVRLLSNFQVSVLSQVATIFAQSWLQFLKAAFHAGNYCILVAQMEYSKLEELWKIVSNFKSVSRVKSPKTALPAPSYVL